MTNFTKASLPVIFSNLEKAAEKQQKTADAVLFGRLASEFEKVPVQLKSLPDIKNLISEDLVERYPVLQREAESAGDRGALRALKWGEKVTTIQMSLIDRYLSKGDDLLAGKELFVCEACGFIFLGTEIPQICPVCKAPSSRFTKV